jgi:hypothetical protein
MKFRDSTTSGPSRGVALVTVLITLTSLLVLLAVFQQTSVRVATEERTHVDDRRAFYLAETALSEAMIAVRAKGTGAIASQADPAYFGGGVLWVEAFPVGGTNQTRLVATAMCGGGRAALEAVVSMAPEAALFQGVLNSRETLTLNSGVMVDSYASKDGAYAAQVANNHNGIAYAKPNGDVLSNQNIVLNANASVFGDATPGPGHAVSFATGSYVSGSTASSPEPFAFPPVVIPPIPIDDNLILADGASVTLPPGAYGYDQLRIGKSAKVVVQGPATIVCSDFVGGKSGRLEIDASGGPVSIYVDDSYTHLSGFEAQPASGSPMALAFLIEGTQDISFPASAKIRGGYYAPNSNVTFTSSNEIWGAFACNRIDMSASTRFHFDESLLDYWNGHVGGDQDPLDMLMWRAVAFEPAALMRDRRDPFAVLGVDRELLRSPAASWEMPPVQPGGGDPSAPYGQ